jgi:hypothetical protein
MLQSVRGRTEVEPGMAHPAYWQEVSSMSANTTIVGILATLTAAAMASCGGLPAPVAGLTDSHLQGIAGSVAKATGYPLDLIEVTGSRSRVRLVISDSRLATAGQAEREQMARSVVVAVERRMDACEPCAAIEALSVAIVHAPPQAARSIWHVEDVVEFRRGPDRRFKLHVS